MENSNNPVFQDNIIFPQALKKKFIIDSKQGILTVKNNRVAKLEFTINNLKKLLL